MDLGCYSVVQCTVQEGFPLWSILVVAPYILFGSPSSPFLHLLLPLGFAVLPVPQAVALTDAMRRLGLEPDVLAYGMLIKAATEMEQVRGIEKTC